MTTEETPGAHPRDRLDQAPGLAPPPEPSEAESLRAQLAEAERERAQFKSLAQRLQADFINFRKRSEEELSEFQRTANAQLLLKLLPVLDDLERALGQVRRNPSHSDTGWVEGMQLVTRKFWATLEEAGVRHIESLGKPFDPWEHEITGYQETSVRPEGEVLGVVQEGYKLHGRVLRPALVTVAKAPGVPGASSEAPSSQSDRAAEA